MALSQFSTGNGLGLHKMQLKIALQGARQLKVGGRMVFSLFPPPLHVCLHFF